MDAIIRDANLDPLEHLTQWDIDRTICITGLGLSKAPTIKFYNLKNNTSYAVSAVLINGDVTAVVPNVLLQDCLAIAASVVIHESSGSSIGEKTICYFRIPVVPKAKPSDYDSATGSSDNSACSYQVATISELSAYLSLDGDTSWGYWYDGISTTDEISAYIN